MIINPFAQMLIFCSTKDILFAAFLLLFGIEFAYVVVDRRNSMTKLILFGILMCLFRNQGIYIAIAVLIMVAILRVGTKSLYIGLAITVNTVPNDGERIPFIIFCIHLVCSLLRMQIITY